MPHEIRIPRLGWSMEEGTFVGWLKQPGDDVAVGDPLFELEGEKALQEIESVDAGKLYLSPDAPQPGTVVPVGSLLGYLLQPGEPIPGAASQPIAPSVAPARAAAESASSNAPPPPAGPAVRRLARELAVNLTEVSGTGKSGRITPDDVVERARSRRDVRTAGSPAAHQNADSPHSNPIASPRARRIAAELGVDWTTLRGTGRAGRIREMDVRAAGNTSRRSTASAGSPPRIAAMTPRRKAIADHLRTSRERTIPVTLTATADATNLVALREQFKSTSAPIVPTYADIVTGLVARVLKRHPLLAARWGDDAQSLVPIAADEFHMGIAVDTPDGLLVPVIRDVARQSLLNVARESKTLIDRARSGRLTAGEMQGGALTITNLGAYGIDAFTPVINYPELSILGLGTIRREPVVVADDRIVPRDRITLSLTFDHAAVDGAPAAAFLQDIVAAIDNPAAHLLGE